MENKKLKIYSSLFFLQQSFNIRNAKIHISISNFRSLCNRSTIFFPPLPLPPLEGKPRKKKNSFHVALVGIDRARHLGREKKISCIPRYSCRNLSYVRKTRTANNLSPAINISIQLVSKRISFNQYYWFSSQLDQPCSRYTITTRNRESIS